MYFTCSIVCTVVDICLIDLHKRDALLGIAQVQKMIHCLDVLAAGANRETEDNEGDDPIQSGAGHGHSDCIEAIAGEVAAVLLVSKPIRNPLLC